MSLHAIVHAVEAGIWQTIKFGWAVMLKFFEFLVDAGIAPSTTDFADRSARFWLAGITLVAFIILTIVLINRYGNLR